MSSKTVPTWLFALLLIYFGFDRYHTDIVMVGQNFEKVFLGVNLFNGKKSILTAKINNAMLPGSPETLSVRARQETPGGHTECPQEDLCHLWRRGR